MKNIFKIFLGAFLVAGFLSSCEKDENRIVFEGGTPPVLTASSTTPMVLLIDDKDDFAIRFDWTNPEYRFTTGISSQDVTYTLQVDLAGSDFKSSKLQERAIANELSLTLTVKELNSFLTRMELAAGAPYDLEMRIKSSLVNGSVPLYSNVISINITPYLDFVVEPPGTLAMNYADGELWIVGDAVASGWSNPLPPPYDVSQKFTRLDVLHYEANINFNPSGGYKLIQKQGVWATQYHALDGTAALSGDFEKRDADPQFPSPGAGLYKVEVNFQTGKYKLTKL
jgi:hypothetical protein